MLYEGADDVTVPPASHTRVERLSSPSNCSDIKAGPIGPAVLPQIAQRPPGRKHNACTGPALQFEALLLRDRVVLGLFSKADAASGKAQVTHTARR